MATTNKSGMNNKLPDNLAESDMKAYVLYIVPDEANSKKALNMFNSPHASSDVWVQDVRLLETPLPSWLKGVPTLVHKNSGDILSGTSCLSKLQTLCNGPISIDSIGMGSIDSGKGTGISFQSVHFDSHTKHNKEGDIKTHTLENYMKLRENQFKHYSDRNGQSKEMVEVN